MATTNAKKDNQAKANAAASNARLGVVLFASYRDNNFEELVEKFDCVLDLREKGISKSENYSRPALQSRLGNRYLAWDEGFLKAGMTHEEAENNWPATAARLKDAIEKGYSVLVIDGRSFDRSHACIIADTLAGYSEVKERVFRNYGFEGRDGKTVQFQAPVKPMSVDQYAERITQILEGVNNPHGFTRSSAFDPLAF